MILEHQLKCDEDDVLNIQEELTRYRELVDAKTKELAKYKKHINDLKTDLELIDLWNQKP